jgi:hypothetical protein
LGICISLQKPINGKGSLRVQAQEGTDD